MIKDNHIQEPGGSALPEYHQSNYISSFLKYRISARYMERDNGDFVSIV